MELNQMLWMFSLGVIAASAYTYFTKRILGGFIRKLFDMNALDESSAVSFDDMGIENPGFFLKNALKDGRSFTDTVHSINGKFYIPEEKVEKAESKYKGEGMTLFVLLIIVVAISLIALISTYLFPEFINAISKAIKETFTNR